jgi:hypothetical protein
VRLLELWFNSSIVYSEVVMKTSYRTIKSANRAGFYRICRIVEPGTGRYTTATYETVVDRATAERFAKKHGLSMPQ